DLQAAIRYEDYGGKVGTTIDPKLAIRWQANDWLTVRGSASTTFRGPPQSLLSGRGTALAFVGAALAFKAIDTVGNPDLEPEEATAINIGFIVDTGNFYGSLDYWSFDFTDPLQVESFNAILDQYAANGCEDGGSGVGSANCNALRAQVFPIGTTAAAVQRIERNWINGSDIDTSGIDLFAEYSFDAFGGEASIGVEGTFTFEFESDALVLDAGIEVAPAQDYVGRLNDINSFTPLPELKGNIFATWNRGIHSVKYALRYVDEYEDQDASLVGDLAHLATIDDQVTHDIHYNVNVMEGLRVSLSVFNVTDEDPPLAALDLNYDPLTHNAFGRMFKLGVTYTAF
ncbi:MAG: TonB-dependent receptor, partial [Gammaproteobacteria bacterium]|nr:TonB-dependent receptor [Gammaproteobacteria bacterium]